MRKSLVFAVSIFVVIVLVMAGILYFSDSDVAVLNPTGTIALSQSRLFIIAACLMLIVVIPALVLTFVFSWKYRAENTKALYTPNWETNHLVEIIWWGLPCLIVAALGVMAWISSHRLDPFKPLVSNTPPVTVQVIALQWKWLFLYPEQQIATVNFVQFPNETPINFELTADAPMNSFWIPQLGGQVFAMPAMRTKLHLLSEDIGEFRGSSSNLSGLGFSGMYFQAKSSSRADFDQWVQSIKESSEALTVDQYELLAKPSQYNPVTTYRLEAGDLFEQIVMKYMAPPKQN